MHSTGRSGCSLSAVAASLSAACRCSTHCHSSLSAFSCTHSQLHAGAPASCGDVACSRACLTAMPLHAVSQPQPPTPHAARLCLASLHPLASLQFQCASMSTPASRARMVKEATMLETQPPPQCTAWRIHEQINHWHARQSTQSHGRTQTDGVSGSRAVQLIAPCFHMLL